MHSWTGFDEAKIIRGKAQSSNQKLDQAFDHPDAEEPPIMKEVTNGNGYHASSCIFQFYSSYCEPRMVLLLRARIVFGFGLFGGCAVHLSGAEAQHKY